MVEHSYKALIKGYLGDDSVSSYDLLGNIAIIDIPKLVKKKELALAKALMEEHRNVLTVLTKVGPVNGVYRTRKLRHIAGEKNFIAEYRENNCTFRFDTRKSFFSTRLSYERSRILALSGGWENVMVMFAGIGPFAIEIAKANRKANVVGIELNPAAYRDMVSNIKLNKVSNVVPELGDVKKFSKRYGDFADRIIMPLPMSSMKFVGVALKMAKPRCTIHLYVLDKLATNASRSIKRFTALASKSGYSTRVSLIRIARPYSAKDAEFVIDFKIRND